MSVSLSLSLSSKGQSKAELTGRRCRYITPIGIGGEEYSLIIDTGSSDTWFVKSGRSAWSSLCPHALSTKC